jgi:predicted ATPase
MESLRLQSFRLKNFKAIRDSGVIKFEPLTIFIGNNGSGKSSIIEGIKAFQDITGQDLDDVMQEWHGYENIWYQGAPRKLARKGKREKSRAHYSDPISFQLRGHYQYGNYEADLEIGFGPEGKELFILREEITVGSEVKFTRDAHGRVHFEGKVPAEFGSIKIQSNIPMDDGVSVIGDLPYLDNIVSDWQFLYLDPGSMGEPALQLRTTGQVELNQDGSNIAEYLQDIRNIDESAFQGIVETLQYVLPYARELQPTPITVLDRMIYLQMSEDEFKVPGWLLSTGTLRLVGILALLRHPTPPPLIIIEELENGLDPRTISLVVDEIRNAVESGKTQIIATTHSPYLLDLLHLSQIVLVDRTGGQPEFTRPADQESLQEWSKKFSPGQLYTMDLLNRKNNQ